MATRSQYGLIANVERRTASGERRAEIARFVSAPVVGCRPATMRLALEMLINKVGTVPSASAARRPPLADLFSREPSEG